MKIATVLAIAFVLFTCCYTSYNLGLQQGKENKAEIQKMIEKEINPDKKLDQITAEDMYRILTALNNK